MNTIDYKKFGLAFGLTGALLYLGCILLMITVGREGTITFFNNILHGLDVGPIIRMNVPIWGALLGIIETFILGWITGACIAFFYNLSLRRSRTKANLK
ncbi:MAG: DUF5676 family membrane protein [Bacteroidia bacterium]